MHIFQFQCQNSRRYKMTFQNVLRVVSLLGMSAMFGTFLFGEENPPDLANNPASIRAEIDPGLPTIFVAGDSTAAKGKGEHQQGWAEPFKSYFDSEKVNVVNRARGGRSSRTFITEGLWQQLLDDVKAGDVVIIQFGHNDGGAINEEPPGSTRPTRARGSLPGLGEESVEIDNVITKQHETVYTFGHYIRQMIEDVRSKDGKPVLTSLTLRNLRGDDGRLERGSGNYGGWTYQLAKELDAPFIDLSQTMADILDAMEKKEVDALWEQDYVHYNLKGADLHAARIVAGLKGLRSVKLAPWLSEKGNDVETDVLAWLRLPVQVNRELPTIFLIGDSTVRNGRGDGSNGQWGWGDFLSAHIDLNKANVVNRAVGGLSSRTYLTYGHWDRVKAMLQPGDVVVMQFGHNDSSAINDDHRARGTIEGSGEDMEEIDNILTGKHEVVHTYGWYLRHFIFAAEEVGASTIVCSPVPRKKWDDRTIIRGEDSYGDWAELVANQTGSAFVDLEALVAGHYDQLGPQAVELLFGDAHTHTSAAGAVLNAGSFVEGLRLMEPNPLQEYLLF